jgi:hypothetical protein
MTVCSAVPATQPSIAPNRPILRTATSTTMMPNCASPAIHFTATYLFDWRVAFRIRNGTLLTVSRAVSTIMSWTRRTSGISSRPAYQAANGNEKSEKRTFTPTRNQSVVAVMMRRRSTASSSK